MSSDARSDPVGDLDLDHGDEPETETEPETEYVLGPARWRKVARLETKPVGGHRSGGYERFRSYEYRPETPGGKEDVYVYHHRLLALLHPELVDEPIERAAAKLSNREVHHKNGLKWDNRLERREADGESNLELLTKSEHSQKTISDQQQLAFAKDQKRRVEREEQLPPGVERCGGCGEETDRDSLATSSAFEGRRCIDCAIESTDGETIEL